MEHIRIIAPGDPGFDWLYDLYMQSFPVHEQRLRERQEGVLGHPEYHCDLLCQGETRDVYKRQVIFLSRAPG